MTIPGVLRRLNERLLPGHLAFGPTHIVLGVNNFCNLRCVMCDVGTGNGETNFGANLTASNTGSMPWDLFSNIVDQISAFCPSAHLAFAYTEPLAWAPLGDALRRANERGLFASVTTNALLLARRARELTPGCRSLSVSIDGPGGVHDRIRRRPGSFARAVAGIEAVASLDEAPDISVFCTITELNAGSLRQFLSDMAHLPLKRIGLLHNNFVTRSQADRHNMTFTGGFHATPSNVFASDPAKIDLQSLSAELHEIAAMQFPFPVTIHPHLIEFSELTNYYRHPDVFFGRRCHDANRILMIDSDGEAIPVHGRCYRFPVGNIRNNSLRAIWHHDRLSELRRTLHREGGLLPACSRCCSGFG
jgi:Fe-coproporphyrin III synthase